MMRIVLAPDSFKGSLTADEAAMAMEKGIRRVLPEADCIRVAMADGGEGTVRALLAARGGREVARTVTGPLMGPVKASYGILADGRTAVVEVAAASGIAGLDRATLNPMRATSYGTGELLADALDSGAGRVIVGLGGSASIDGGAGLLQALGVRFYDGRKRLIRKPLSGGRLDKISYVDTGRRHPGLKRSAILLACDVDNPLYGRKGAARVFGPQKGASTHTVELLDKNLRHFFRLIKKECHLDIGTMPGGGAAGGIAAGLYAFSRARVRSGAEVVAAARGLRKCIRGADLVITGEGSVDSQTLSGKVPLAVTAIAGSLQVPVIVLGGSLGAGATGLYLHGVSGLESTVTRPLSLEQVLQDACMHLEDAAERVMRLVLTGQKIKKVTAKTS